MATETARRTTPSASLNAPDTASAKRASQAPAQPVVTGAEACCIAHYWAVVETDGTLVRGHNVWRVAHLGTGVYEVVFTGNVTAGVYTATIGRPGIATEPSGEIGVALRCCLSGPETNNGVWVNTTDSSGQPSDRAFHLVVHTAQ
jgi:hypothetical protein